jgi:hypothetical protein
MLVSKYRLYCEDCEGNQSVWGEEVPTTCPVNTAHTIDPNSIVILEYLPKDIQNFKQIDTDKLDPTEARTVEEGFIVDIQAGVNPSRLNILFDFDIDLLSGKYYVGHTEHETLDKMGVDVIPPNDDPIGTVAQAASSGQNEIYVDANVLQNIRYGFVLKLQASEKEYRIREVDYQTGKVILAEDLDADAQVGHTVKLRIPFVINQLVLKNTLEHIGDAAVGSSNLPKGWALRISYYHVNDPTVATKLGFALAYKY